MLYPQPVCIHGARIGVPVVCLAVAASSRSKNAKSARVPHPIVFAALNVSRVLTCESEGQPLRSCLWGRVITDGQWEGILVDERVVENGGRTNVNGISYVGNGLDGGNCSVRIDSVTQDDIGTWSCALLANGSGSIFKGEVNVLTGLLFSV